MPERKNKIMVWLQALRIFSFTATLLPIVICAAVAYHDQRHLSWFSLLLIAFGILALHAGTNLVNDYFDYKTGLDKDDTLGSSRVLVDELLTPPEMLSGIIICYFLAALCGSFFLAKYGWPVFVILAIGLIGSFLYTGGGKLSFKYLALGEIATFLLIGPLLFAGAYLALTGSFSLVVLAAALPVGLWSAAIVSSNNVRDFLADRAAGIKTIATLFGRETAANIFAGEIFLAYLLTLGFIFSRLFNFSALLILFILPPVGKLIRTVRQNKFLPQEIPARTAQLQLVFGLILALSFVLPR